MSSSILIPHVRRKAIASLLKPLYVMASDLQNYSYTNSYNVSREQGDGGAGGPVGGRGQGEACRSPH